MTAQRLFCEECGWVGPQEEVLWAPDPFSSDDTDRIMGCPRCRGAECLIRACEIEGCTRSASIGDIGKDGVYRLTCHEHAPWRRQDD